MTVQLVALTFNATAPDELARFWAQALRWSIREVGGGGVELVPTDSTSFGVLFRQVPGDKDGQNRIHFDLTTTSLDDQHDTVAELVAIGGRHTDIGGPNDPHVVLADPEGNEFCVIEPDNRFLASCPRLGAVNCDGTRALGYFFSEALGWPMVWDQDEETAIQAPGGTGPKITWSGPPLMPRSGQERLHLHLAPASGSNVRAALDHLLALGATRLAIGQGCPGAIPLADVDGNELCLVEQGGPSSR
jgi:predicted enzyme related to lactoylglutathione lyase